MKKKVSNFYTYKKVLQIAKEQGFETIAEYIDYLYTIKKESTREIAKNLGMSFTSVVNYCKILGIQLRGRGGPNNKRKEVII